MNTAARGILTILPKQFFLNHDQVPVAAWRSPPSRCRWFGYTGITKNINRHRIMTHWCKKCHRLYVLLRTVGFRPLLPPMLSWWLKLQNTQKLPIKWTQSRQMSWWRLKPLLKSENSIIRTRTLGGTEYLVLFIFNSKPTFRSKRFKNNILVITQYKPRDYNQLRLGADH